MDASSFSVIYEDNHLLVVSKPAMLATMGVRPSRASLLSLSKKYIQKKYEKPGNVYLGTVSRLDVPVSGIVVFARTSKAAARLTEQFRMRQVDKIYWALLRRRPQPDMGEMEDWLERDPRHRRMHVCQPQRAKAQWARLTYRLLTRLSAGYIVEIRLETGRKHQIRLQLGSRGYPIRGDQKYGGRADDFPHGIALHARRVAFEHPVRRERMELTAALPSTWRNLDIPEDFDDRLES